MADGVLAEAAALRAAGRRAEAIRRLEGAIRSGEAGSATEAERRDLLGRLYLDTKQIAAAVASLTVAAELAPARFHHRAHLAAALEAAGEFAAAEEAMAQAVSLAPSLAELPYNLGTMRLRRGEAEAAISALARAIQLDPRHTRAALNLGSALREAGRPAEAEPILRSILADPAVGAEAEWNLALALLQQGAWEEGWRRYEARRRLSGFALDRLALPAWGGGSVGRLLVQAEQGLGDTLQFLRFLAVISDRAERIALRVQDPLVPLLSAQPRLAGVEIVGRSAPLPQVDAYVPLLSLAGSGWPPLAPPYLIAPPDRAERARAWLGERQGLRVGICWQGNRAYRRDGQRSIPAAEIARLVAGAPGCRWIALQRGEPIPAGAEAWPGMDEDGAFLDTAGLIAGLDLVITSDTAVAHLAGALGARVWLLLGAAPDWRWGLEGERTPWYPMMRLIRQDGAEWGGVMERVGRGLEEILINPEAQRSSEGTEGSS